MAGVALAENAEDEAAVDNGTQDLVTIVQGYVYNGDQSISGIGFANIHNNLASVNSDGSKILSLRDLGSGSGAYSYNSSIYVRNSTKLNNEGEFEGSTWKITAKEDVSAAYSEISLQIPGSFRSKPIRSLWKDQTCAQNNAGLISMNSLFDYAKTLNKESTTTLYSNQNEYEGYVEGANSTISSSMDLNAKFDGAAHIGATLNNVNGGSKTVKPKDSSTTLIDEDYKGSFSLTKKMDVTIKQSTGYSDFDTDDNDYPWLPCMCGDWNEMTTHDQRYHSAKGFFDCATCSLPQTCKNQLLN